MREIFFRQPAGLSCAPFHRLNFRHQLPSHCCPARARIWLSIVLPYLAMAGMAANAAPKPGRAASTPQINSAATGQGMPSTLSCQTAFVTGAMTDLCTVVLTAASSGPQTVILSSDNSAVLVPATITVPANAESASFNATVASVSSSQTATLTATADEASKTFTLRLSAAPSAAAISVSTTNVAFGSVPVDTAATPRTVTITSSGSSALTISGATVTGGGFSISGLSLPVTINPGDSATLTVGFYPASAGTQTGTLTITSNAASGASVIVSLSGAGTVAGSGGSSSQPALINPTPGSVLPGSTATFVWTTASSAAQYQLWVGTSGPGSANLGFYSAGSTSASTLSVTVGGIPTSGAPVYVLLLWEINGVWSSSAYTYNEKSGGALLSALSCASASLDGAASDSCVVALSAAAPSGGIEVSLTSSSPAVSVPGSISIPAGSASYGFTAVVSGVTTPHTVTLTANGGGGSSSFVLQLNVAAATLALSSTSVAFGNVALHTQATQSVTLSSTGGAPLTISGESVSGAGFSTSGVNFPLSLNAGQTATLNVSFDPSSAGASVGVVSFTSNSSSGSVSTISLSGSGQSGAGYSVDLSWHAPGAAADPNPIAGYNIYRALSGSSSYQLLNPNLDSTTSYTDSTVVNGKTYIYEVTAVDSLGLQSAPSGSIQVEIP